MIRIPALPMGVLAMLVAGLALTVMPSVAPAATTDANRIARGFKIAPVPLNLAGLDRNAVGLGSYIVNAQGGCNDCHTNPSYAHGRRPVPGPAEADQHRGLSRRRHRVRAVHLAPTSRRMPRAGPPASRSTSSSP